MKIFQGYNVTLKFYNQRGKTGITTRFRVISYAIKKPEILYQIYHKLSNRKYNKEKEKEYFDQ